MIDALTGHNDTEAYLVVREREQENHSVERVSEVAEFAIRYLPDSNEVVLCKRLPGGESEAVYSELLD